MVYALLAFQLSGNATMDRGLAEHNSIKQGVPYC